MITALQFYQARVRDGRALLTKSPPESYGDAPHSGRPYDYLYNTHHPVTWLVQYKGRLLLVHDAVPPVQRIVEDGAQIVESPTAWRVV